ncbi:MAG TPA: hypothetical protein VK918_05355 [Pyrinomonadaceae bacterium]|nr:hypothetical protein [Pyrinomonadaceae bacterium]
MNVLQFTIYRAERFAAWRAIFSTLTLSISLLAGAIYTVCGSFQDGMWHVRIGRDTDALQLAYLYAVLDIWTFFDVSGLTCRWLCDGRICFSSYVNGLPLLARLSDLS